MTYALAFKCRHTACRSAERHATCFKNAGTRHVVLLNDLAPGSWLLAPATWLLARGSWLLAPISWLLAPGSCKHQETQEKQFILRHQAS